MTDITKCDGEGCPVKEHCYRFTAICNENRQTFLATIPGKRNENSKWECEMFWGEPQERIMKQLNDILNGKETNSN
jgi:hypothetical protein